MADRPVESRGAVLEPLLDEAPFEELRQRPTALGRPPADAAVTVVARLQGFDIGDRPLVTGVSGVEHEIVVAETTVRLRSADVGERVIVVCQDSDPRRPIILGVVRATSAQVQSAIRSTLAPPVSLTADDEEIVLTADRQIVLKCGRASITLTRAGKVLIQGTYVVSRSSGYNKIKGAAVDIN